MDKLEAMSGGQQKLVSNKALRDALEWDDARYERIRSVLLAQNQIILGKGYGGSVGLSGASGSAPLNVFISYCHADEDLKNELLKHLEPLRRLGIIKDWHDRKIKPGEDWGKQISDNLEKADIILLLVSIDFINSAYCYDVELDRAIERHSAGEAVLIPIILRSCMWKHTQFATIQAVPKDGRPVALWDDKDEAFVSVAEAIKQKAEELMTSR